MNSERTSSEPADMEGSSSTTEELKEFIDQRQLTPSSIYQREKSSYASVAPWPKSGPIDPFDIIDHLEALPVDHPPYTINDLIPAINVPATHGGVVSAMVNWLTTKLRQCQPGPPCVSAEHGLGCMGQNQLWLKATKRVDIAIHGNSLVYVQFEIESNRDRDATVRKLAFGLTDQLRFLNNRGVDICDVAGFYVPVGPGYVEKVTCTWENEKFCYAISATPLRQMEVLSEIKDVYTTQAGYQLDAIHRKLTLPLTPAYVRSIWGPTAYQVPSGGSIVIIHENLVYKYPLKRRETATLRGLHKSGLALLNCSLPISETSFPTRVNSPAQEMNIFFKFSRLNLPLAIHEAKVVIIPLLQQVVVAIEELHGAGLAHQDIRLDNICLHPETGVAMLIDLDRSCSASSPARRQTQYGQSTLYTPLNRSWIASQIDWRQLAIMAYYILSHGVVKVKDYNKIEVPASSHTYFVTMFSEGRHDQGLAAAWKTSMLTTPTTRQM